jgi:hypothetical protein
MSTEAIRQWVETQGGMPAIWANPNAPRPSTRPYATVQIIENSRVHEPFVGPPDGTTASGEAIIDAQRDYTVSIQVYESVDTADPRAALQAATALRDSLEKPSVKEALRADGWVWREVLLLTDNPQLIDMSYEPRATFDVRFGRTESLTDDIGVVEAVELTGTTNDIETTRYVEV